MGSALYFFGFLLDTLCAHNSFPGLNWAWNPKCLPIHIYYQELWEEHYRREMYVISEHFMASAHNYYETPLISEEGREVLSKIKNWYLLKYFTYSRVSGLKYSPYILPKYVPNRIMIKELAFQIFKIGHTNILLKRKVKGWPEMPLTVGLFQINNQGHAQK